MQQTPLFLYRQPLAQTQAKADATRHWEHSEGYKVRMWRQLRAIPEEKKQDSEREGERYLGAELRARMRRMLLLEGSRSGCRSGDVVSEFCPICQPRCFAGYKCSLLPPSLSLQFPYSFFPFLSSSAPLTSYGPIKPLELINLVFPSCMPDGQ